MRKTKKHFVYFEETDGGIEFHVISDPKALNYLYNWMTPWCKDKDDALLTWMQTAKIGEVFAHRLGFLVRVLSRNITANRK